MDNENNKENEEEEEKIQARLGLKKCSNCGHEYIWNEEGPPCSECGCKD